MIDLARLRGDLPSATMNAYFNAGTFGPLPKPAADAMRGHLEEAYVWGRVGTRGYAAWGGLTDRARTAFAAAAGAPVEEIALNHSTTDGCNTVIWALDWAAGDEVITTTHEHPGLTAPLEELARRQGVVIRMVEPTREAIAAALTPRTRLVAISHVLWTDGAVLEVADISADAHAAGAQVLVDGAQGGGAVSFAAADLGCDYYTYSGQKWLCGPSGTGALWVSPEALDELATPWPWYLSRNRHSGAEIQEWTSARRLDAGTVTLSALAGVAAALEWRSELGLAATCERAAELAATLREQLAAIDTVVLETPAAPSTIVAFRTPGREPADVVAHCEEQGVLLRQIPTHGLVRASVGFWNDERDLGKLVAAVR
jgi:L-cysteine/cystine lyase